MQIGFESMCRTWSRSIAIGAGFLCAVIGGIVEIAQGYFSDNRTMDIYDMIANLCGIVIAVLVLKGLALLFIIGKKSNSF
jgi:VanZ family protein